MEDFKYLAELSGTPQEQAWLTERLETLSVRESYALSAERYLLEVHAPEYKKKLFGNAGGR